MSTTRNDKNYIIDSEKTDERDVSLSLLLYCVIQKKLFNCTSTQKYSHHESPTPYDLVFIKFGEDSFFTHVYCQHKPQAADHIYFS